MGFLEVKWATVHKEVIRRLDVNKDGCATFYSVNLLDAETGAEKHPFLVPKLGAPRMAQLVGEKGSTE